MAKHKEKNINKTAATEKATELLAEIGRLRRRLKPIQEQAQAEMEAVKARYPQVAEIEYYIQQLDKEIQGLMKKQHKALFADKDKVTLDSG